MKASTVPKNIATEVMIKKIANLLLDINEQL
jgi:hypothetical protein